MSYPVSLSETHTRIAWWYSHPGLRSMAWTARGLGASLCSDKCAAVHRFSRQVLRGEDQQATEPVEPDGLRRPEVRAHTGFVLTVYVPRSWQYA
jgi:hypothetical protein